MRRQLLSLTLIGLLPGIAGCVAVSADEPARSRGTSEARTQSDRPSESPERGRVSHGPGAAQRPGARHDHPTAHPGTAARRGAALPPAERHLPVRTVPPRVVVPVPRHIPQPVVPQAPPLPSLPSGNICDMAQSGMSEQEMRVCRGLYSQ
ncbi:hypothetical protein ACZ90_03585 [Streptomyces albus subsp. albus]|nr:hypothetical protein ACZ90_03585 [Streptomyces albus subsp. albus]